MTSTFKLLDLQITKFQQKEHFLEIIWQILKIDSPSIIIC